MVLLFVSSLTLQTLHITIQNEDQDLKVKIKIGDTQSILCIFLIFYRLLET